MMESETLGDRIRRARGTWDRSQRELEAETGIDQSTLSRIETGERDAKLNEVVSLSWALGYTVSELTGQSPVRARVECAARAGDGAQMIAIQEELKHFLELDAYLDEQGIPAAG